MKLEKHLSNLSRVATAAKKQHEEKEKEQEQEKALHDKAVDITREIICSYISHNSLDHESLTKMINQVYECIKGLGIDKTASIDIASTIHTSYLVCLEDGKKMKMLTKHLKKQYNLTPAQYREKWNLPSDYPMVAPGYSKQRSAIAKRHGFGSQNVLSSQKGENIEN